MPRIFKLTDRIKVKIDDFIVYLSPLSIAQKREIQILLNQGVEKSDYKSLQDAVILCLKRALKNIEGVLDSDDNDYKLSFTENELSEECLEDLLQNDWIKKVLVVCNNLVRGIPTEFLDDKQQPIPGVEIIK